MGWLSLIRDVFEFAFSFLEHLPIIRAILGFVFVFLLPGFAWTLVFFNGRQVSLIERLALSFGLSIAVVTLTILSLNKLIGIGITGFNSVLVIIAITIIPVIFYSLKRLMRQKRGDGGI